MSEEHTFLRDFRLAKLLNIEDLASSSSFNRHIDVLGSRTTGYLKRNLFNNQSSHRAFIKDTKTAIKVFKHANYIKEDRGQQKDVGSTAVLLGDRLFVANVE
ncbi:probable protein phosphatase 2C 11 isoform X2 [Cucurbita moschata]|uniref:Probable protein phosphatase 2C 11 isoform X2 n=1 Tax=Cucurbita moschata TaxID=3662 RepID=A0A6J1FRU5_CUCMO|nr:probable protein phosphatase 2C 11 isoform X2 [Cucurbita moschata]